MTASAARDLDGIVDYIVNTLCNAPAAVHLLDEWTAMCRVLEETPMAYPACRQPLLQAYRKAIVMGYVVIYRIGEDAVFIERCFGRLEDYEHKL